MLRLLLTTLTLAVAPVAAQDPPRDAAHPAAMTALPIPSHGQNLNAVLYTAAGAGLHPTVLLLHGFPGNEQNLDLAQAMRRAGWNVLTLHYRGAWGTPGVFSFRHVLEDADSALAWLRSDAAAAKGIDRNRLVVIGHSMGGMATAYAAGHDNRLIGAGLISAASMGAIAERPRGGAIRSLGEEYGATTGMHTLAGTSSAALVAELAHDRKRFMLETYAAGAASKPILVVSSDDGLGPEDHAFAEAVRARPAAKPVTEAHFPTDHSYSDQRLALQAAVVEWLATLPGAPTAR